MCFVSVLCVSYKFVDHGGHWGNMAHALDQWQHPVASSEALDVLHQVMCPTLYCCIAMAIEIASDLPVFFILVNLLLTTSTIELNNIVL
jgi:hypothetical protein